MNEIKIPEQRLMDLLMVERSFKEVLEHLYQSREVATAHGDGKEYTIVHYNVDTDKLDEILKGSVAGFKEEIKDEV